MTNQTPSAAVAHAVMRLPFQVEEGGANPAQQLQFTTATTPEINSLLAHHHYLGPVTAAKFGFAGWLDHQLVMVMAWKLPTARMLPADGTWLELSRWCITPAAGKNAGSQMMGWVRRWLIKHARPVHILVSYSDPKHGHTGALYKASGWSYAPTHHSLRFDANGRGYPSGHGSWNGSDVQSPKHRWIMELS